MILHLKMAASTFVPEAGILPESMVRSFIAKSDAK